MCSCDWNFVCSSHRGTRFDHWYWHEPEPKTAEQLDMEQRAWEQRVVLVGGAKR